tara:strand:- start:4960 stop:7236 length:2277 start_codon:yes stop_codon:yes gene_type:complete
MAKEYSPIDLSTLASSLKIITDSQELFVDPAGGDDSNDGSAGAPYESIYAALTYLNDKHLLSDVIVTIRLKRGIHRWDTPLNFSHPQGNQIQIIGDEPFHDNRSIGSRNTLDRDGIYFYEDTSAFKIDTPLQGTYYNPQTTSCLAGGEFPSFPSIVNPEAGADLVEEPGSRWSMFVRPYQSTTPWAKISEDIQIRHGNLANAGLNGPNDFVIIHPWCDECGGQPGEVSGQMRFDIATQNLDSDQNRFGPNTIRPLNDDGEPEYPVDVTGRYDENDLMLRRFMAMGCHRLLGISAGVAGTDANKDFILENLNTNRNQFRNLDASSLRATDLSSPASPEGNQAGKAYGELDGFLKFNYVVPRTYVFTPHLGSAIFLEGNRSLRLIENICFTTIDRLSASSPTEGAAIHVDNNSTINIGQNIHMSNYKVGIHASSGSSVSWLWENNATAPVITKCETGILSEKGSSITLGACCVTGCGDGIVAEKNSEINLQDSIVVACTENGFSAVDNSNLKAFYCFSLYNGQRQAGTQELEDSGIQGGGSAFLALNGSTMLLNGCLAHRSSGPGFHANNTSSIDCSFSDSRDCLGGGVAAVNNSSIRGESVFIRQPGVVGIYAYNNSSIDAPYSCSLYAGVDGPTTVNTLEPFGDGVTVTKNSTIDADGLTAERPAGNNVVCDYNSSFSAVVPPTIKTSADPSEGYYSVVSLNGGKVVIDDISADTVDELTIATGYDGSVRFFKTGEDSYIVVAADNDETSRTWSSDEG